jgi:hypothetical protein
MNLAWLKTGTAWQPLTFAGVALFATASLKRLLLIQFIFALLAAATVVWFLDSAWSPSIREAILNMPESGEIRDGKLDWPDAPPQLLAEGHFLGIVSDLRHTGEIRVPAHIQVELGRHDVRILSLFGYRDFPYPIRHSVLGCNRIDLLPRWGAWRPPILWVTFGTVVLALMLAWAILAFLCFLPVWLAGYFANRQLSVWGSWKLAGAALMPGCVVMILAILCYGFGLLDPVQLTATSIAHFLAGLVYSLTSPHFLPKLSIDEGIQKNPFEAPGPSPSAANPEIKVGNDSARSSDK